MSWERLWQRHLFWVAMLALAFVHFHDPSIFSRALIKHDDETFVGGLKDFSVHDYFTKWLFVRDKFAFPLRDLTFLLDFRLSRHLGGVQLFWLTSAAYYVLVLWVVRKICRVLMPGRETLVDLTLAFVALHPTNVETIQWVWIRKHVLAGLFVSLGTLRAVRIRARGGEPRPGDWAAFVSWYVCSLLCYPTGILWIGWLLYYFRASLLRGRSRAAVLAVGAGAVTVGAVFAYVVIQGNRSFADIVLDFEKPGAFTRASLTWLCAVGRGVFNLVFPFWIGPYYTPLHPFAWAGLAIALGTAAWIRRLPRPAPDAWRAGRDLCLLAVACFLSSSFVLFNAHEYIWGDHYAYLPLLFLAPGLLLLLPPRYLDALGAPRYRAVWLVLLAACVVRSSLLVGNWKSDLSLMGRCAEVEGSPRCIGLAIEKAYDTTGCPGAVAYFGRARANWARFKDLDFFFQMNAPFYEGLCNATVIRVPLAEKDKGFAELEGIYGRRDNLLFGKILALLHARDAARARELAYSTFLSDTYVLAGVSHKEINLFRGMGHAICSITFERTEECRERLKVFDTRYSAAPPRQEQIDWAVGVSLREFMAR